MGKGTIFELVAYLRLRKGTLLFSFAIKKMEGTEEQESLFFLWESTKVMERKREEELRRTVAVFSLCKQK